LHALCGIVRLTQPAFVGPQVGDITHELLVPRLNLE
jgi:hypothetical protein